jgi:hypothetical protein
MDGSRIGAECVLQALHQRDRDRVVDATRATVSVGGGRGRYPPHAIDERG